MKIISVIYLIISILLVAFLWSFTHTEMLHFLFQLYPLEAEQQTKFKEQILTLRGWFVIRIVLVIMILSGSLLVFYVTGKRKEIRFFLHNIKTDIKEFIKNFREPLFKLNTVQKRIAVFLFVTSLIFSIYSLKTSILHIDEAFSYVHFSSKGFLVSALYYPNPNNHIFYNITVSIWESIWFSKFWAVKMPSLLALIALQVLIFRYVLTRYGFWTACLGVIFLSLLSPLHAYSVSGRGYVLQMLFFWLAVWSLEKISEAKIYRIIFVGASILGFYTIPTFLYVFVGMGFALWKLSSLQTALKLSGIVAGFTFLLYLPVYLLNGKENLLSESWQQEAQKQFKEGLATYWLDFADFWIGIENTYLVFGIFMCFILIISALYWNKIQNKGLQIQLLIFVVAMALMMLQQRLLPVRIWTCFGILWMLWLLAALQVFQPFWQKIFLGMLISLQIAAQFYQKKQQDTIWQAYGNFEKIYPQIPFKKGERIFSNDLIYQNLLSFYNIQDEKGLWVDYSFKNKVYDWLVLDKSVKNDMQLGNYELFLENEYVKIWKVKIKNSKLENN